MHLTSGFVCATRDALMCHEMYLDLYSADFIHSSKGGGGPLPKKESLFFLWLIHKESTPFRRRLSCCGSRRRVIHIFKFLTR
eukprot:c9306_g1_i1 orf=102-347(+)